MNHNELNISVMLGKTINEIRKVYDDELHFYCDDGSHYKMYSDENECGCDVKVFIDDVCGDLEFLTGCPLLMAESTTNAGKYANCGALRDSFTWTYYKLATRKGYVTITWYGESNGYYREKADFELIENEDYENKKLRKKLIHNIAFVKEGTWPSGTTEERLEEEYRNGVKIIK